MNGLNIVKYKNNNFDRLTYKNGMCLYIHIFFFNSKFVIFFYALTQ